ncbi:mitogen-activated protein kinase kinase kinase kinase 1 isoform X2 [Choloepus didactylus]|uniref:mitogen-activated protein kinase kinase kinase kinase 1 isoform X2 n=1 Tax=Choloepus didactylus TaxID=27675 RepID=UPI00189DF3FD|nr:mitogen-activated protein kinase kinase kinase kinase 1 isoform X2 [Choloepus didactylus]
MDLVDPDIFNRDPRDHYDLLQRLGGGTYGEVFKARDKVTRDLVALKMVKMEPDDDVSTLQKEILILKTCRHANIVAYHGSYLWLQKLWICMEFCGAGSLQDVYQVTGPLSELQISYVCREVLQGLAYLHLQKKIHRDIKGANILINDSGEVRLADFGISAQIGATLARRLSFIGTPYWMAPEVAAVALKGGYNELCDIWSLGITAIELAELQPPLFDVHPLRVLFLMTKSGYQPPRLKEKGKWSAAFHNFVKVTLTKNPKKRPCATKMLSHQLVSQPGLNQGLILDLLDKLRNPVKGSPVGEIEDEEPEIPPVIPRRIRSTHRSSSLGVPDADCIRRRMEFRRLRGMESRAPTNTAPFQPPRDVKSSSPRRQLSESDDDYDDVDIPTPAEDTPPPLPPKPKFRSPSDEGPGGAGDEGELNPGVLVRCASGPPPRTPRLGPPPATPSPHLTAHSEPSLWNPASQEPDQPPLLPPKKEKMKRKGCAHLVKLFNGCPLRIHSTATWTHPSSKDQHLLLGAEEGIFILNRSDQEATLEMLFSGRTTWLYCINNILMSLSGLAAKSSAWPTAGTSKTLRWKGMNEKCLKLAASTATAVLKGWDQVWGWGKGGGIQGPITACFPPAYTHAAGKTPHLYSHSILGLLERKETRAGNPIAHISPHWLLARKNMVSTKIQDTKGCRACCVAEGASSGGPFLCGALETSVVLLQWYQPMNKFLLLRQVLFPLPTPLPVFALLTAPGSELPVVCIGVSSGRSAKSVLFHTVRFGALSCWLGEMSTEHKGPVQVTQVEDDMVMVLMDGSLKLVTPEGAPIRGLRTSEIPMSEAVEAVAMVGGQLQAFWKHGVQVWALGSDQMLQELRDPTLTFRLLGSPRPVVVETRPADDPTAPSNLYIQE